MNADSLAFKTLIRLDKNAARRALNEYMDRMFADWEARRATYQQIVTRVSDPRLTEYWRQCCLWWDTPESERNDLPPLEEEKDTSYIRHLIDAYHDPILNDADIDAVCELTGGAE